MHYFPRKLTFFRVLAHCCANQFMYIIFNFLFSFFIKVSGLLNKSVLRPAKSGSGERISKTVKQRMAEYYHDMLWQNVGELVQQSVLWYDLPGYVHLPFALQHPRICLGLSNVLNDNMYSQFGGKLLRIYHCFELPNTG